MFCPKCGAEIADGSTYCPECNSSINNQTVNAAPGQQLNPDGTEKKSKLAAGLLGIFLGGFGVHNFYLGFTGKAVAQLVISAVGWLLSWVFGIGTIAILAAGIWGLVEGIMYLTGSKKLDAKGNTLKD